MGSPRMPRIAALLLPVFAVACSENTTAPSDSTLVRIGFSTSGATALFAGGSPTAAGLTVEGTNGTLVIDDLRLVVGEFELEQEEDDCLPGGAACVDFESLPFLVNVPLDGGTVQVASDNIPAGVYRELEFESMDFEYDDDADDVDGDDEDDRPVEVQAALTQILEQLRAVYPDLPLGASMVARGTFTPTGGSPQPFTVYFDAEVEIEMELNPPIELPASDGSMIVVNLRPELWFVRDGQVINLAAYDGRLIELEVEFEDGFEEIEFDDD
ncbi:MAG TPA: hypothetical protein VFU06_16490 [Longimicrobiales bacterium]|nr:hypothetical protein [Longimicrobiales bacterium]